MLSNYFGNNANIKCPLGLENVIGDSSICVKSHDPLGLLNSRN